MRVPTGDQERISADQLQIGDEILIDFMSCVVSEIVESDDCSPCNQGKMVIACEGGVRRQVPITHRFLVDNEENRR